MPSDLTAWSHRSVLRGSLLKRRSLAGVRPVGVKSEGPDAKSVRLRRILTSLGPLGRAEEEVAHDWVLREELERQRSGIRRRVAHLTICLPEEDPSELIAARVAEVRAMCSHSIHADFFLSLIHI